MANNKILIVDDERHILDFYGAVLSKNDYENICVTSAAEALEAIEQHDFDVIVTDYQMPNMNGIELLEELAELKPDIRRLMITGSYGTSEQMSGVLDSGLVHRILSKPCGMEEFLSAIREQIDLKSQGTTEGD